MTKHIESIIIALMAVIGCLALFAAFTTTVQCYAIGGTTISDRPMPDYRAICADLVDLLQPHVIKADKEVPAWGYYSQTQQFIDRTRWHLARSIDDDRRALEQLDG